MRNTTEIRDFDSLFELIEHFESEENCVEHLAILRWNEKTTCPYCNHDRCYQLKGKTKRFKCGSCRKQFSVRVGTIFHDSKISLRKWFIAIYLITSHKKGISSHKLARDIKVTQKTAWFILQRVRKAFEADGFKFRNDLEVDETYIGDKEKNQHKDKKTKATQESCVKNNTTDVGTFKINGKAHEIPVKDTNSRNILPIMRDKV